MFSLRDFIQPWRKAAPINSLFAPHVFIDNDVLLTKANALCAFLDMRPPDDESMTTEQLDSVSRRMQSAFRHIDERFTIYQYVVKQGGYQPGAELGHSAALSDTLNRRREFLGAKGLYQVRIVYALLYEGSAKYVKPGSLSPSKDLRVREAALQNDLAILHGQVDIFQQIVDDILHPALLDKHAAFAFLRLLANLDPAIAESEHLVYDGDIDYFMASTGLTMDRENKRPCIRINHDAVEVLTMREPPRDTKASVLRELLAIPGDFILCSQFRRVENRAAVGEVFKGKQHFTNTSKNPNKSALIERSVTKKDRIEGNTDEAASDDSDDMGGVLRRINKGEYLGMFSLTIVLHGHSDRAGLLAMSAQVAKVLGGLEASTIVETYNASSAYLAIIPGNTALDLRRLWLLSGNYADMSFVTAPASGWPEQKSVVTVTTNEQTPYHLDLYWQDVFGILGFGARGAGKTVFGNLLIDHSQKNNPYTFILDLLGGYREITRKHNGAYAEMRFGDGRQTFRINPFCIPGTDANKQFQVQFIKSLLKASGHSCSGAESDHIFHMIGALYVLDAAERTLGTLTEGLSPSVKKALRPWVGNGQYGSVFDNQRDTLTLARFQTFDFQGMEQSCPDVLEPLLFYVFHRISKVVHDPALGLTPKQLWMDEGWRFLVNDTSRDYFVNAARTWRTYNAGVGMFTQSASALQKHGVFEALSELCPIKILLASPGANVATYQQLFKLNDRQAESFATLVPKRQALVLTPGGSKVINIQLDPAALAEYGSGHVEKAARRAANEEQQDVAQVLAAAQ